MAIPNEITAEHVRAAISKLHDGVSHGFGQSSGYDVLYEGERYSPKAVVGLAAELATGQPLHHRKFSGGESPGATNPVLRGLGFSVVDKDGKLVTGPSGGAKSQRDRVWERLTFGPDDPSVRMKYMGVSFDVEVSSTGREVRVDDALRDGIARVDETILLEHLDEDSRKTWAETKKAFEDDDRVTMWRCGTALISLKNPKRKTVNLNPYVAFRFVTESLLGSLSEEDAALVSAVGKDLSVNALAELLGVDELGPAEPLQVLFQELIEDYPDYAPGEAFGNEHPLWSLKGRVEHALRSQPGVKARPTLRVAFAGKGRLARDLWVAILDSRVTTSVRRGHYVVYLFKRNMTGVFLTLNQGVTDVFDANTADEADTILRRRAASFRTNLESLGRAGFSLDGELDLAPDDWGKKYESSTVAHKYYAAGAFPDENQIVADLEAALAGYDGLIGNEASPPAWWVFQSDPKYYRLRDALASGNPPTTWLVEQHSRKIRAGDRVFLWEYGGTGVLAVASVRTNPAMTGRDSDAFVTDQGKIGGEQMRVAIEVDEVLPSPITRETIRAAEGLSELSILRSPTGTNFPVTAEQADVLLGLVSPPATLAQACVGFTQALQRAGLSFGDRHDRFVRSFLASVATKSFVILTGLSGSGKTQIALKFGQWLGEGRHKVVPVRPDWTGPEALLGYENALGTAVEGRLPWTVPESLKFMLRARDGAGVPHLLLLDEMNLAHVERYFADILSGMESRQPCLPNLRSNAGAWIAEADTPSVRVPRNLFIVGTVNVDETTYMFSPKVLDRANTLEFRVKTSDLPTDLESMGPPGDIETADPALAKVLLDAASDHLWHTDPDRQPDWLEEFAVHLRALHALLSVHGFEFGHRVFVEAIRFAVIYAAMESSGDSEEAMWTPLDLQVMQKILPRLHGARRTLDPLLRELGSYAMRGERLPDASTFDPVGERRDEPALPDSYDKIQRMTAKVRANQFASFAE